MTRGMKIRKLDRSSERMWSIATMNAMVACSLGRDGLNLAVISEDTLKVSNVIRRMMDDALLNDEAVNTDNQKGARR